MDEVRAELLRAYDSSLREDGEVVRARDVTRDGPLVRARFGRSGFVSYRDLAGLDGAPLDVLIERTVAYFRDRTEVDSFEWKTRGHDAPAGLGERLLAHGFEAEDQETVMVGEARSLAVDLPLPSGLEVRRAGTGSPTLERDLADSLALQERVFGGARGPTLTQTLADVAEAGEAEQHWLVATAAEVVCAGRLSVVPGTDFAGLWGGACAVEWRGRGLYRALTAARARAALALGVRYLHSDCTPMSRPILERSGLLAITTTTPYVWTR